jgi:uncharacterized protein
MTFGVVGPVSRDEQCDVFFDGTARGQFLIKKCQRCDDFADPRALQCPHCHSFDVSDIAAAGTATVVSWAVVHPRPSDATQTSPTIVAIAELAEGPWWWAPLVGASPDHVRTGLAVEIGFERATPDSEAVPVFHPATDSMLS